MSRAPISSLCSFLVLGSSLICACSGDAQLSSRFAPDFTRAPHTVAVFGVYKDGRMSSDAWEQVGAGLSRPFGATCDAAYPQIEARNQTLSGAIDDYARANGVGDELLEQLAPAAQGDLILVISVAGRVGSKGPNLPDQSTLASGTPGVSSSKYRTGSAIGSPVGGPSRGSGAMRKPIDTSSAFEMTASLYSVAEKKSVGAVTLEYDGKSVDEAVARLAERLGQELPGSRCGSWNWDVQLDDHRIRDLGEP
jgi:hypothetical protein